MKSSRHGGNDGHDDGGHDDDDDDDDDGDHDDNYETKKENEVENEDVDDIKNEDDIKIVELHLWACRRPVSGTQWERKNDISAYLCHMSSIVSVST